MFTEGGQPNEIEKLLNTDWETIEHSTNMVNVGYKLKVMISPTDPNDVRITLGELASYTREFLTGQAKFNEENIQALEKFLAEHHLHIGMTKEELNALRVGSPPPALPVEEV